MKLIIATILTCFSFHMMAAESAKEQPLKPLSEEKIECHGMLNGKEFWLRLLPAKKEYGNMRVLELLYTPPTKQALDGCHLIDHPQILFNQKLELIAWKEGRGAHQSGLSGAIFMAKEKRYDIAREVDDEQGEVATEDREIKTDKAMWDLHLTPMLMALCELKSDFNQGVCDLYGAKHASLLSLKFDKSGSMTLGGEKFKVSVDDKGRLKQITNAKNEVVIRIDGWK